MMMFESLEMRAAPCGFAPPPADVWEMPDVVDIFADEPPADADPLARPDEPGDFADMLPDLEPEEDEPPDADMGLPPFLPLPPAPIEPYGPA